MRVNGSGGPKMIMLYELRRMMDSTLRQETKEDAFLPCCWDSWVTRELYEKWGWGEDTRCHPLCHLCRITAMAGQEGNVAYHWELAWLQQGLPCIPSVYCYAISSGGYSLAPALRGVQFFSWRCLITECNNTLAFLPVKSHGFTHFANGLVAQNHHLQKINSWLSWSGSFSVGSTVCSSTVVLNQYCPLILGS